MLKYLTIAVALLALGLSVVSLNKNTKPNLNFNKGIYNKIKQQETKKPIKVPELKLVIEVPELMMKAKNNPVIKSSKKKNLKIKRNMLRLDFSRVLSISGEVSDTTLVVADAIKVLDSKSHKPIYILIDSPGGSVFAGARVVAAMQHAKSPVYTICVRLCASMAFIIHQYGDKRLMFDRSVLMSHFATTGTSGDVERIKSYIEMVQKYVDRFSSEIADRAGMSLEDYRNLTSKDLWLSEEEAVRLNFSDEVVSVEL